MWLDQWHLYVPYLASFFLGIVSTVAFSQFQESIWIAPVVVIVTLALSAPWPRTRAAFWWTLWIALGFVIHPLVGQFSTRIAILQGIGLLILTMIVHATQWRLTGIHFSMFQVIFVSFFFVVHTDASAPDVSHPVLFAKVGLFFSAYTIYDILYRHLEVARGRRETLKLLEIGWILPVHRAFLPLVIVQLFWSFALLWRRLSKFPKPISREEKHPLLPIREKDLNPVPSTKKKKKPKVKSEPEQESEIVQNVSPLLQKIHARKKNKQNRNGGPSTTPTSTKRVHPMVSTRRNVSHET